MTGLGTNVYKSPIYLRIFLPLPAWPLPLLYEMSRTRMVHALAETVDKS